MKVRVHVRDIVSALLMAAIPYLYGCETPSDSTSGRINSGAGSSRVITPAKPLKMVTSPGALDDEGVSTAVDARPAALVDGKTLAWGDLRPTLNELAGADALQEIVLDRKIAEAVAKSGLVITPDDVAAERKLLLESLNDDPDVAVRLLDELRDRQRLGKSRFEALMERNAALRAMVRNDVKITDAAIRNMHEMVHGPKRQPRIMVLPNLQAAQNAINLVNSGVSFGDVAVEMSTDSSAARGGILEPISRADPAYPDSVRQTLWTLNPGEMSGPVLFEDKYAVVMLVKRIAGDGMSVDEARAALERMVRINQERLLMDQLAHKLIANTSVTVFDESLNESWQRHRRNGS